MVGGGAQIRAGNKSLRVFWGLLRSQQRVTGPDDGSLDWQEIRAWDGELGGITTVSSALVRAADKSVAVTG